MKHYKLLSDEMDSILKEVADGYGDMVAASIVHNVSFKDLQSRLEEIQTEGGGA